MTPCWSCTKVKGKRHCPARGGDLICSRCCGTKRGIEIPCPADCPYLNGSHDPKWTSMAHEKEAARFFSFAFSLDPKPARCYLYFHHAIVSKARALAALDDGELRDVVETALKTLETRSRGILYSHPSTSPHLQPLSGWLIGIVALRERIKGAPPVSEDEALTALRAFLESIEAHIARKSSRERYLQSVERILSEYLADAPELELPPELSAPKSGLIVSP